MTETVTISRQEYETLISAAEDLADLAAVRDYLNTPRPGLPSAYVKRMLDGESLLTLWREHRDFTQAALAKRSGVNRIQIGDIESRGKTGSVETLAKLADALDIVVDDLIP